MGWLFGIVVFLTIIYFLRRSPEFRILALVLVALVALWLTYSHFAEQNQQRREASAISPTQVELSDMSLRNSYGSWRLTGLVTNNSQHELRALSFDVLVENCVAPTDSGSTAECHIVGQSREYVFVNVPSGQQRSLSTYVSLPDLPPLSDWNWRYTNLQTTANLSDGT